MIVTFAALAFAQVAFARSHVYSEDDLILNNRVSADKVTQVFEPTHHKKFGVSHRFDQSE